MSAVSKFVGTHLNRMTRAPRQVESFPAPGFLGMVIVWACERRRRRLDHGP